MNKEQKKIYKTKLSLLKTPEAFIDEYLKTSKNQGNYIFKIILSGFFTALETFNLSLAVLSQNPSKEEIMKHFLLMSAVVSYGLYNSKQYKDKNDKLSMLVDEFEQKNTKQNNKIQYKAKSDRLKILINELNLKSIDEYKNQNDELVIYKAQKYIC